MRRSRAARGNGKIGCVIWLAIVAVIGYGLYKVVPMKVKASKFEDFMEEEAAFGSIKSPSQIEKEILAKARVLGIPVTKENLKITKVSDSIIVEAHYELTVDFAGIHTHVFKFDPVVKRPLFLV